MRTVTEEKVKDSFFNFFKTSTDKEQKKEGIENQDCEEEEEMMEEDEIGSCLELDYVLAELLANVVIRRVRFLKSVFEKFSPYNSTLDQ